MEDKQPVSATHESAEENCDYSWYQMGKMDDKKNLEYNCSRIQELIEKPINRDNINAIQDKLIDLAAMSSLSAETVAQANKALKLKQEEIITIYKSSKLPASILKLQIDSKCAEEFAMFTLADRLNAAITHVSDSLRTIISYAKTELQNNMKQ